MPAQWRVITPTMMDELPTGPGVFEFGSLVRSVLYVGAAPAGLAPAIRRALSMPGLARRAHCVRFEMAENAESRARMRLDDYRKVHSGELPDAHRRHWTVETLRPGGLAAAPTIAIPSSG